MSLRKNRDQDLVNQVIKRITKLRINDIEEVKLSDKKDKKLMVLINDKWIHFGQKNSVTFIEGADEKKRNAYRARASKITRKNGEYTYNIAYTANFLSYHLLW